VKGIHRQPRSKDSKRYYEGRCKHERIVITALYTIYACKEAVKSVNYQLEQRMSARVIFAPKLVSGELL